MNATIVFAYATRAGLAPVPGAAPWAVLARQLPRWVVNALNQGEDRGLRYFPFLGMVDGVRRFLEPEQLLAGETLRSIHGQTPPPRYMVDGLLDGEHLALRLSDGETGAELRTWQLSFDPLRPLQAARHAAFELGGALGLGGVPPAPPELPTELEAEYLLARDAVLTLEAGLLGSAAEHGVERALRVWRGGDGGATAGRPRELQTLLVEAVRLTMRAGLRVEDGLAALRQLAADPQTDADLLERAASLAFAAQDPDALAAVQVARAARFPDDSRVLVECGGALVAAGRSDEALRMLRAAVGRGCRDVRVRARLAACEELAGDLDRRDRTLSGLLDDLDPERAAPEVLRLLASWLIDRGRYAEAVRLIDRGLEQAAGHVGLWIERGRSELGMHRAGEARQALEKALELGPSREARSEIDRLLKVAREGGLLPELAAVEQLVRQARLRDACRAARRLARRHPEVAEVWLLLGIVRQRLGHVRRAIRALREALARRPELAEAHNRLGILLATRGREAEGYVHLRHAVELVPEDPTAWLHLAQVSVRLGHHDEARYALRRAEATGGTGAVLDQIRAEVGSALE